MLQSLRIVADDLSGAADCAASFAGTAGPVPVFLRGVPEGAWSALDTDTRAMDEASAVAVTRRVFGQLAAAGAARPFVYKKIDSTLRGHVGAELAATGDGAGEHPARRTATPPSAITAVRRRRAELPMRATITPAGRPATHGRRARRGQATRTPSACGPFEPVPTSKVTAWPSSSAVKPGMSIEE